jgi:tetratricopeptide (TPR) repeat protein
VRDAEKERGEGIDAPTLPRQPRVFISYSHDSEKHREHVLELANRFRSDGIDAWLDLYEQAPPEGWPRWMQRQLQEADFILVICTESYKRRFEGQEEPGKGRGVTWEGLLAAQLLYEAGTVNRKLVPILLENVSEDTVPLSLRPYARFWLPSDYDALYRLLTAQPDVVAPPLGETRRFAPAKALPSLAGQTALSEGLPSPEGDPDALAPLTAEMLELRKALERLPRASEPRQTSPIPFTREWFWDLLQRLFGRRVALVLFGIGVLAVLVEVKWPVEKWPPVKHAIEQFTEEPLPKERAGAFNLGIAHLSDDEHGEQEEKLRVALENVNQLPTTPSAIKGAIVPVIFDRTIRVDGPDLHQALEQAHDQARRYLEESGFNVLLWGRVLGKGSGAALKLYWTSAEGKTWDRSRAEAFRPTENQALPELFWNEMQDVLNLMVAASAARGLAEQEGQFVADQAEPFVRRVRDILRASSPQGRTPETTAALQVIFANGLSTLGEQSGRSEYLVEAISSYGEVLKEYTRGRVPLDWAMTQNNLGAALRTLGEREPGTARLEEAVAAYREALEERTRERVPLDWAMTQNNLGAALRTLGERESGTARLEEAVAAYREALEERTRERVPLQWAATQNNLGAALRILGERESGTARLEEAVAAYREALKEYTPESSAYYHEMVQRDLAGAEQLLANRRKK